MKKGVLVIVFFLCLFMAKAQVFDMTSSWTERASMWYDESLCEINYYKLEGDTVINELDYTKVYKNNNLYAALRESDEKLFALMLT